MFNFIKNLFDENQARLRSQKHIVSKILQYESEISKLSDKKLAQKTNYFKKELESGKTLDQILPEAYAVVREAIYRTIGEKAYEVQLYSAITLHQGAIAEQRTGEGKTHSVIFPAYLNALTGKGVHIITPNDYLTRVGAGWYPKALHQLNISSAAIIHEQSFLLDPDFTDATEIHDDRLAHLRPITRQEAYAADITYGTNNEFGFDYLRDHMIQRLEDKVQRQHHFAVVDEVDFVLIDEARTPLIISSPNDSPTDKYYEFAKIAEQLQANDYVIDEKSRSATLSEFGIRKVEKILKVNNLYEESFETIHYIENAIKARAIFLKDKDYIVKDGEVIIVDEFTGRLMKGRRWSDGLHQAVEAKEGVIVQRESRTWATITFQNYFRLYEKLSGMTGTAATEREEFKKIYNLDVVVIPTHRPVTRQDHTDLIFKNQRAKYTAIANRVKEIHATGQPILIGTTSIEKNQIVADILRNKGIPFQMLNAKNHRSEAEIIAQAGKKGTVTVATNMAGRGVDIILGGPKENVDLKKWQKDHQEVLSLGGLYVIGTERHESRRIDNQLRGRAGRQGDPGSSQFYVSLEDDLMRIFGGEKISSLMTRFNMPDDQPLTHSLVSRVLEQIQVKVEGYNFDIRKNVVEYDDVINKQRKIVYQLRDQAIENSQKDIDWLQNNAFKYLDHQLEKITSIYTNLETGYIDAQKITLEFSEILPMDDRSRSQLKKKLETENDPKSYLLNTLQGQWQQRVNYFGQDIARDILVFSIVSTLDPLWVDHLTALDDLRDGVRLRGYAQKDPLIEYRKEGYDMFQSLMDRFEANLARKLFRLEPKVMPTNLPPRNVSEGRGDVIEPDKPPIDTETNQSITQVKPVSKATVNINRNDPCWCGSGKKWKKCHYPEIQ